VLCVQAVVFFVFFVFYVLRVFVIFVIKRLLYCVTAREAGGFGRVSLLAMSQLAWCTSRAIFSIFT
jgi:hypothetical protein